jgi:hypothetical protein
MVTKTLYLAWQDTQDEYRPTGSRLWFPIGRLDADDGDSPYRFRYTKGAEDARLKAGFHPLPEFPEFERDYRSSELFPTFTNRVISPKRPDFKDYLQALDITDCVDPIEILAANGGQRATDTFEVFPQLVKGADGSFACRFFLHGGRHTTQAAQERVGSLQAGDQLNVALELTNPVDTLAVQIQTADYHMIGWAPRYLVDDLAMAMAEHPGRYSASVVRVNPIPAPSSQRVLIEMCGTWKNHEPMSSQSFVPLVE